MKRNHLFLLFVLMLTSFALKAQYDDLEAAIPLSPEVKKGTLSNGLTYYIRKNEQPKNLLQLRLVVNAGSILEDESQLGLAHFMEHMNFNGTRHFQKNELIDYLESVGVKFGSHLNAYTSFDETVYTLPIPTTDKEVVEKGFQILEDWAHGALLLDKDIEDERGVVLEEYRSRLGAEKRMQEQILPVMLNFSRYTKRFPIGTQESIQNFAPEELRRFYRDWYRPDLMAVVAVGDIDVEEIEAKIHTYFSRISPRKNAPERFTVTIPPHKETLLKVVTDPEASYSSVNLIYKEAERAQRLETVGDYRELILRGLFRQIISMRIAEETRKPSTPFLYARANYGEMILRDHNAFQALVITSDDQQLSGMQALLRLLEEVKQHGFTQGELERAKLELMASMKQMFQEKDKATSETFVRELVGNFLSGEAIPGLEWEYGYYQHFLGEVELEEVNALLPKWMSSENRVIVFSGPEQALQVTEKEIRQALNAVEGVKVEKPQEEEVLFPILDKQPASGQIDSASYLPHFQVYKWVLENGMQVLYKKTDFQNNEILFNGVSYGGTAAFSDADFQMARFGLGMLTKGGVGSLNPLQLAKALTGKNVSVSPYISQFVEGIGGSSSAEDLETAFQLIHQYFSALRKDTLAFQSFVEREKAVASNAMVDPQIYFSHEFSKILTQDHPRTPRVPGTQDLDKIEYNRLMELFGERFQNAGDFTFAFVGNIEEALLADYVKTYLASLPGNGGREKARDLGMRTPQKALEKIVEKGTEPQSQVVINLGGEMPYSLEESYLINSLATILQQRLTERMREELGSVYSVWVSGNLTQMPADLYNFKVQFFCAPENVHRLKNVVFEEMDKLCKQAPTKEEIAKIREADLQEHHQLLEKNAYWLQLLINSELTDISLYDLVNTPERIRSLDGKKLKETASKYLQKPRVVGILLPEKTP